MRAAVLLATLLVLPGLSAGSGSHPEDAYDGAHDAMVTRGGLYLPVDSIDVLHAHARFEDGALQGATLRVLDLERRGLEDRLFVRGAHAVRAYVVLAQVDAFRVVTFAAFTIEPAYEGIGFHAFAIDARPGNAGLVPVEAEVDAARGEVRWTLGTPVPGEARLTAGVATLHGCETTETCDPTLPYSRVKAGDTAPQDGSILGLSSETWWDDLLPEDDGSLPDAFRA